MLGLLSLPVRLSHLLVFFFHVHGLGRLIRLVNLLDVIQVFNLFQDGYMELAS